MTVIHDIKLKLGLGPKPEAGLEAKPVTNERALLLKGEKETILVVADLHIGFEYEVLQQGIRVPSQTSLMKDRLDLLLKQSGAKKLVILGDVKHMVPGTSYQEMREIPEFLQYFADKVKVEIVYGNHDANLEYITPKKIKFWPSSGIAIGNVALFHGHAWPSFRLLGCDYLVFSHIHPTISITDFFGMKHRDACWVMADIKVDEVRENYEIKKFKFNENAKVVIMPAFNPLLGGISLNDKIISEAFMKCVDVPEGEVYMIDGTNIGKLKNIM